MADGLSFPCKQITYEGRDVPILMQNENGPCPLLALANCLLLRKSSLDDILYPHPQSTSHHAARPDLDRGKARMKSTDICFRSRHSGGSITIHSDISVVSFETLTSLLAEYMLERNVLSETNDELRANQQKNITDCMALFPKLNRGLDVNVKFDKVDGLEYSEDLLIFDLMHTRLLHGWLVDPQDRETYKAVAPLSYNQLVEKVIEMASPANPRGSASSSAGATPTPSQQLQHKPSSSKSPTKSPEARDVSSPQDDDELQAALQLSMQQPSRGSPPPSPPPSPGPAGGAGDLDEQAALDAALALSLASPGATPSAAAPGSRASQRSAGLGEALIAQDWLARSSSQLTHHGLVQLHSQVSSPQD